MPEAYRSSPSHADHIGLARRAVLGGLGALAMSACATVRSRRPSPLAIADFRTILSGLEGVEGIAVASDGRLFLSNGKSALVVAGPDGNIRHIGEPIAQTGIAIDLQGRAIVGNVGLLNNRPGPLQRVDPERGTVETLVAEIGGRPLVASNCPAVAPDGTIYCTHSAWDNIANIGRTETGGFVYAVTPEGQVGIVADGLRGPNGCCVDAQGRYVYVVSTPEGRVLRFPRMAGGRLGPVEHYGPVLGEVVADQRVEEIWAMPAKRRSRLGYCDGIVFDASGNLWVTLPFANRIIVLTPAGERIDIAHDAEGKIIDMPTNLAMDASGRQLFIACRGSGSIARARTEIVA